MTKLLSRPTDNAKLFSPKWVAQGVSVYTREMGGLWYGKVLFTGMGGLGMDSTPPFKTEEGLIAWVKGRIR